MGETKVRRKGQSTPNPLASDAPEADPRLDDRVFSIVRTLQQEIVFGRLKPRERLLEEEMSVRFSVGRHVIRAALDELDRSGLVVRRPNRGATVRDYSASEIRQMYEVRCILHREAAMRIKLPGSPELVSTLRSINEAYRGAVEKDDLFEASQLNDRFHKVLNGACSNTFLVELIEQYWLKTASTHSRAYATRNMGRIAETIDEHDAMITAVESGSNEELAEITIEHMGPALDILNSNIYGI
ncbi:GntR family transcriptional regulator [Bosea sp. (in: a-proteobacteria)]|uniref:GntR family transcriptional regulator n=1 Tax=Bosea sp. (in: a-proteobacteria) TaxID=1871050 RepID=UPI00261F7078|nr:GntR family transcriptional regulator [Bosea sp. (in: a-proteobacteria)]MCO5090731.1 GntR family transcriptional regulator [Bosea sp. (in: a-proteobacteria)]